MPERKIVAVVNNELDIRYYARRFLKDAGYGVRLYDNTEDALQLIDRPADLAILDTYNPPLGGVELCRRLRGAVTMPVIFMSGQNGVAEEELRGSGFEADRYVCVTSVMHIADIVRDTIGPPFDD